MKKTNLVIIALFLCFNQLIAQEKQSTLFGDSLSLSNIGIMVEPGFQLTSIDSESATYFQFRGGIVFKDKITIGGFYGYLMNDIRSRSFVASLPMSAHIDSWTAGGFIEYTLYANKVVHLTFPMAIGVMELEIDGAGRDYNYEERQTLFFEPKAQLELNLHRFARLNAGLGYRVMGSSVVDRPNLPQAGNALTFQIGLKMGLFKFN